MSAVGESNAVPKDGGKAVSGDGPLERRWLHFSIPKGVLKGHLILVFLFFYIPIAVLIGLSFNESGLPTSWGGFSTKWYVELTQNENILESAFNTLLIATISTFVATILGTLLALGVEMKIRHSTGLDALLFAPMIIPDIVLALALLSFFSLIDAALGLTTIIISHIVFNLAFVCAVVRARLKNFNFEMIEASRDLGAGPVKTFFRVVVPALAPGILAAALLAFTLSIDEYIISYFTAGATSTLPIQIFSMIRFGVTPEVNALATIFMLVSFTIVFASQRLNRGKVPGQ